MAPQRPYSTVLFDLDGTLVDNFGAIYRAYAYALDRMGLPPASFEKVKATVGGSVPVTMERLVGKAHAPQAVEHFSAHFPQIMFEDLHALPGVEWLLARLHNRGLRLAVFTNKSGGPARAIIEYLGLEHYFTRIVGTEDSPWRKPEPEFTQHILDELGVSARECILIGDSPFDIQAAAVAGIPAHVVATGSHSLAQLEAETDPAPAGVYKDCFALGREYFGEVPPREEE